MHGLSKYPENGNPKEETTHLNPNPDLNCFRCFAGKNFNDSELKKT